MVGVLSGFRHDRRMLPLNHSENKQLLSPFFLGSGMSYILKMELEGITILHILGGMRLDNLVCQVAMK
jgi:hypothetical protein